MKILFVSDVYFPRVNGVSTSIETFRNQFIFMGHTVHLIAPDYGSPKPEEQGIYRIPARRIPFDPEDRLMNYRRIMELKERLRSECYDLLHIQTPFVAHYAGVQLSRQLGIPCVETYHTYFEEYLHHYIPLVPRALTRYLSKRLSCHQGHALDAMVVPSNPMQCVLRGYGISVDMHVVPTGLSSQSFVPGDREEFRRSNGIDEDRPVLLFVGRVAHEKNIGFLLNMLVLVRLKIPKVLLVIAGEGPAQASLVHEVHALGLSENVRFMGYLDRGSELNSCYRSADLFVFSSRTETQGLVLLEAMAQCTPVVSTAELGTKDVLQEGKGVWIANEDVVDFSEKVVTLLGNFDLRRNLGHAACDYAHEWSAVRQAARMLDLYRALISRSFGSAP